MISDDEGINGIPIFIIGCVSSSSSPLFTLGNRIEGKPSFSMQPRCLYPNCALFTRWWIAKIVLSTMIVVLAQTSIVNSHWIWALFPAVFHSKWFTVRNNQVVFGLLESVDEDVDFRIILIKPVSLFTFDKTKSMSSTVQWFCGVLCDIQVLTAFASRAHLPAASYWYTAACLHPSCRAAEIQ